MMPGQANGGQDLDFSLRAQREMYQSLGMGMAPGSAQGGADSSRLGGLGGGMQPRPAGALGALGMSVNVPSFAAALDEHSQRIQAQAASTMANMLQQDQAALYQQSQAAAQRQPQAQQPLAGMTQQQFTQQLSHTYTQQLAAQQQQVAQQFAAQQAAAVKAQQQVMMRANQAMAAAKKPALPTAANVTPRNVGGQSAQQAAAQAAAARRPFPISSRDLKGIVAAHREELGQVIIWRRAVHNEHSAACEDEEDAALTRYVRNAELLQEIFTRAGTSDPAAEKEREERDKREIQEARRRVMSLVAGSPGVVPEHLDHLGKRRKRLDDEAELISHVAMGSKSSQEQVTAALASYTEKTGVTLSTHAGDAPLRLSVPAEEMAEIHAEASSRGKSVVL